MINTPKSESSKRILPIPPRLLQRLRQHKEQQQREREQEDWKDHDLIFASEVGTPISPRNLSRHYKIALELAGVPTTFRFHDLRHFCGTTLGEIEIPEHVIGSILGHSKGKNVTRRYTHATLRAMHAAVNELEELVLGGKHEAQNKA